MCFASHLKISKHKNNQFYIIPVSLRTLKWKPFLKEEEDVREVEETKN